MTTVAIIPARGGSKRLPRKNAALLGGVPLIVRAVDKCHKAGCFDTIAVSTDDPEIADLSRRAGAEVVYRPPELCTDEATSESAVLHALRILGIKSGVCALVQCTSPFTRSSEIMACVEHARRTGSTAFTAVLERADLFWYDEDSHPARVRESLEYGYEPERWWKETGGCYAFLIQGFLLDNTRFTCRGYLEKLADEWFKIVPTRHGIDIDTAEDLAMARGLLAYEKEVAECLLSTAGR